MKKNLIWLAVTLVVLIGIGLVFSLTPLSEILRDRELLLDWFRQWGAWAPLISIGLHIAQVLTAPIPGTAIDAVNGLLFGPWLGTLYSMIGLLSGSIIAMVLARRFGRPLVERFVDQKELDRLDGLVERYGSLFIFLIFLIPFLPDDVLCFIAGLTPIPLLELILLAMLGRTPGVFVANWLGSRAGSLTAWQWGLFAVIFLVLVGVFWRYRAVLPEKILSWVEKISGKYQKENDNER